MALGKSAKTIKGLGPWLKGTVALAIEETKVGEDHKGLRALAKGNSGPGDRGNEYAKTIKGLVAGGK